MSIQHDSLGGIELHVPFKMGEDTEKTANLTGIGDVFGATDTGKIYRLFKAGAIESLTQGLAHYEDPKDLVVQANATNPTYQADVSADYLAVEGWLAQNLSITNIDITQSGANGLDTGTEANDTIYYIYVIFDIENRTFAGLFSESSTTPTMPSGYTQKRLVGSVFNNSSGDFEFDYEVNGLLPVATTLAFSGDSVPDGFLECDGAAISRTSYSALFSVIGENYGNGDGSTTFNLPDYRGEFLRGWDHGAGNDPDAASRTDRGDSTVGDNVGTKQSYAIASHSHTFNQGYGGGVNTAYVCVNNSNANFGTGGVANTGGNETRPRNINTLYCIKY